MRVYTSIFVLTKMHIKIASPKKYILGIGNVVFLVPRLFGLFSALTYSIAEFGANKIHA